MLCSISSARPQGRGWRFAALSSLQGRVESAVSEITELLAHWRQGDRAAGDALASAIYPVLRDLARAQLRRHGDQLTLRATELAHEAYERLLPQAGVDWRNRAHFYAIAATVMRRVVIDYLRMRSADKRGGDVLFVPLQDLGSDEQPAGGDPVDWLAVDQALNELATLDADSARVVEMRLFTGLSVEEIAGVLDSSTATVGRQWRFARTWLADRLGLAPAPGHDG
jgi:RNA polymerase sigma factor (TIGR02999 family)